MTIPRRLHSQRWLTRRSVVTGQFVTLTRHCPMRYQHFSLFGLGGANPWAKFHQNRRWPATHPGVSSCQISSPCVNPRRRYPLQIFADKQTVNDISAPCLTNGPTLAKAGNKRTMKSNRSVKIWRYGNEMGSIWARSAALWVGQLGYGTVLVDLCAFDHLPAVRLATS